MRKTAKKSKFVLIFACFLCLFRFIGCSAKPAEHSKTVTDNNFKQISRGNPAVLRYNSYNDDGYYNFEYRDKGGINVLFTDFASAKQVYLCNRAECNHNDDTCTSYFNRQYTNLRIFPTYDQEKILCLADYHPGDGVTELQLISFDKNGENRNIVIDFGPETYTLDHIAISDNYVLFSMAYLDIDKNEVKNGLIVANYKTGEWENICDLNFEYSIESVLGDKVYLSKEGYENNEYTIHVYVFDLSTGDINETYKYVPYESKQASMSLPSLFLEKYLYKLNSDGTVFEKVDLDTGECTAFIDNINNYFDTSITNYFYDVVDKRFRIETLLKVGEDEWEKNWYAIDTVSGQVTPLTIEVMYNGGKIPIVYPVAEFGDNLLVICGVKSHVVTLYGPGNEPYDGEALKEIYGIISKADYYANIPNIKIVEMI